MHVDIIACSNNWENCAMWVQDAISLGTNITAEITEFEANSFVRMCNTFAEYPKYSTIARSLKQSELNTNQVMDLVRLIEKDISQSIETSQLQARKQFESEIISTLEKYIHEFDPSLKLYPFGSSHYGIRITNANLNILVTTSKT